MKHESAVPSLEGGVSPDLVWYGKLPEEVKPRGRDSVQAIVGSVRLGRSQVCQFGGEG